MNVIMTCGGTGGHIYPAIAIADKIKENNPEAKILFIGTKRGMENQLVPAAGYKIEGIDASGIDRHHLLKNFKTAADYVKGDIEAKKIIRNFKPDVVIGTGGYVTGTVISEAKHFGAKCYIHESNAYPGLANKLLEGLCDKVFITFPEAENYFRHKDKIVLTGNPIRKEFVELAALAKPGIDAPILICGGSLGAEMVNKATLALINKVNHKIVFVTGKRYYNEISKLSLPENVELVDYENNMPKRMAEALIVVSRSGAMTLSEILASGKPAVFIPSPNVTANHQYHNAKSVADAGAGIIVEEKELQQNIEVLADRVEALLSNLETLKKMSDNAKSIAKLNATEIIYQNIYG